MASGGCGGVLAGDRMADWLSQQNSHSLLSSGPSGRRLDVDGRCMDCVGLAGVRFNVGGGEEGIKGSSSKITVAFPSSEVERRTTDEDLRRSRGGGSGLVGFVRRDGVTIRTEVLSMGGSDLERTS